MKHRIATSQALLLATSVLLLAEPALAEGAGGGFAGGVIRKAYCDLVYLIEGDLGGLLMTAAGVMGLAAAAFGDLSSTRSFIIAGIGAAVIGTGVSVYFGDFGCHGPYTPEARNQRTAASDNPFATLRVADEASFDDGDPVEVEAEEPSEDPFQNF